MQERKSNQAEKVGFYNDYSLPERIRLINGVQGAVMR
jgi:hypothetical protein